MKEAVKQYPVENFRVPDTIEFHPIDKKWSFAGRGRQGRLLRSFCPWYRPDPHERRKET